MNVPRLLLGLVAVGALVWLAVELAGGGGGVAAAPALTFTSSNDCRACHTSVFEEWSGSEHATSWVGADVRAQSLDFSNQECIDCHAPAPVFVSGIGERVLPRNVRQVEGVDCIACHALPEGGVAARRTVPDAPCRPTARPELSSPNHCAGCHNQHKTVDQWHASNYSGQGMSCLACHMPEVARFGGRMGRSHASHGGTDIEFVRAALRLDGERDGDRWVVLVENAGVGHTFPTDERSRAADLFWRPLVAEGADPGPWRHFYRFRDPYRHEVDLPRTLLEAHETRRIPVLDDSSRVHEHTVEPQGQPVPGAIEVGLFYKRSPYYADPAAPDPEHEATLVHRIELVP